MPYNKEQLRDYWQTHKVILNQKRREKRRLAKLGLISGEVSQGLSQVSQTQEKVSHQPSTVNSATANLNSVSHGKPGQEMANLKLTRLIKQWQTSTNYSCPPTCLYSYCSNC